MEEDLAYDTAIELLEKEPTIFRNIYNHFIYKLELKKAKTQEAKAEIKYLYQIRKAFQTALNDTGGMGNLRKYDTKLFEQRYFEKRKDGLYYKHVNGKSEKVYTFNGNEMIDSIKVKELVDKDYSKKIHIIDTLKAYNEIMSNRFVQIEPDITFGKFNLETGEIVARYSIKDTKQKTINNLLQEYKKIKNDTNSADRINQIEKEILNITGIEVQDNGTIFDFVTATTNINYNKYGRIADQISAVNNIKTKIDNKEYNGKIKYDNNARDKTNIKNIYESLDTNIIYDPNGNDIRITKKGIDKTLNSLRKNIKTNTDYKNALLYTYENIGDIIKNGVIIDKKVDSYKANDSNTFDYILGGLFIENEIYTVLANIRNAGDKQLHLTRLDLVKIKRAVETSARQSGLTWVNYTTSPTNNIQQDNKNVKGKKINSDPNNRYSLKESPNNYFETTPYETDAEFFEKQENGTKNFKWNALRNTLSSRINYLYNQTDFPFIDELNSNIGTIARRNAIAHQLLDKTIGDILIKENIDISLKEFITQNKDHYNTLRKYVREQFKAAEYKVLREIIDKGIAHKITQVRELYKLNQTQVKYRYNHPEQVRIMLETLSNFRKGILTGKNKNVNAFRVRENARQLLKEVEIPVTIDGKETTIKRPLIRIYSDLDMVTDIELNLQALTKTNSSVLTLKEYKALDNILEGLIKRTKLEVEFKLGDGEVRPVADLVYQAIQETQKLQDRRWELLSQ